MISVSSFSIKVTLEEEFRLDKQRASLSGDRTAVAAPQHLSSQKPLLRAGAS